jgi:hypothetical protein
MVNPLAHIDIAKHAHGAREQNSIVAVCKVLDQILGALDCGITIGVRTLVFFVSDVGITNQWYVRANSGLEGLCHTNDGFGAHGVVSFQ